MLKNVDLCFIKANIQIPCFSHASKTFSLPSQGSKNPEIFWTRFFDILTRLPSTHVEKERKSQGNGFNGNRLMVSYVATNRPAGTNKVDKRRPNLNTDLLHVILFWNFTYFGSFCSAFWLFGSCFVLLIEHCFHMYFSGYSSISFLFLVVMWLICVPASLFCRWGQECSWPGRRGSDSSWTH